MERIRKKLIELGLQAYNKNIISEGKSWDLWVKRRDSLIYKLEFLEMSLTYLFQSMDSMKKEISSIDPHENKKIYNACFKATKTATYHLECLIYQLLSSLDNVKSILPFFYKDLSMNTPTMRKMYRSIKKQHRLEKTNLRNFTDTKENNWLITDKRDEGMYGYRAEIYHWLSELCAAQASLNFPTEEFSYNLKLSLPEKLFEITRYEKEIEIEDFAKRLLNDYHSYLLNLLSSVEKDVPN